MILLLAFLSPERLLILVIIPALILAYIFASLRKNRRGMRFTNNVSVVSMAGAAAILVPPTTAHSTVENAINSIQLQESTAIGEGIATALRALQQAPKDRNNPNSTAPGAIVLLSDGANNAGRAPLQAAAEARAAKVPIYTIAYGTDSGYVDLDGKREPVPVDHEEMKQIAAATNGEDFAAATADQLKKVYQNIGSDVGYEKADREVTARFAGCGLALAVLARWVPFLWEQNGRDGRSS